MVSQETIVAGNYLQTLRMSQGNFKIVNNSVLRLKNILGLFNIQFNCFHRESFKPLSVPLPRDSVFPPFTRGSQQPLRIVQTS